MSARDSKALVYHLCRQGWHEQLLNLCDSMIAKKNKDAFALFWRAYALGMAGNVTSAISVFEDYQAKRDLQFPSTLALAYFHQRLPRADHDLIEQLNAELSVAEDVTVSSPNLCPFLEFFDEIKLL